MTHIAHVTRHQSGEEPPVAMLRWVFRRHANAITCEVEVTADRRYEVSVVPHWDVSASAIERFDSAHRALQRHAELAQSLRERGWAVVDHAVVGRHRAAGHHRAA